MFFQSLKAIYDYNNEVVSAYQHLHKRKGMF